MPKKTELIFSYKTESHLQNWRIVDDVVMGGRSNGSIEPATDDIVKFSGEISLENNGGFSSVIYDCPNTTVRENSIIRVRLKGNRKRFQFRVKHNQDTHSYINYFQTNSEWQVIEFAIKDLFPTYRGKRMDLPKFNHHSINEVGFLIGNKKKESFYLLIEKMELVNP